MLVRRTKRFTVLEAGGAGSAETQPRVDALPRVALRDIGSCATIDLLRLRGFVLVGDLGAELESRVARADCAMQAWYEHTALERKRLCVGGVYVSENGLPMFYRGFELQSGVRECFRVAVADTDCAVWPEDDLAKAALKALVVPLRRIADVALLAALGLGLTRERVAPHSACDDLSLLYSFYYPNTDCEGGANGGACSTLIDEHVDPSLVVLEPVAAVPGLEVWDPIAKSWLGVEKASEPGKELVLFAGAALAHATRDAPGGAIPGCRHRVLKSPTNAPRHAFVYEQKYAAYFGHLRKFGD